MKLKTEERIKEAIQYCNENDKSTEFMIEYIKDYANVNHECVMNYLYKNKKISHLGILLNNQIVPEEPGNGVGEEEYKG